MVAENPTWLHDAYGGILGSCSFLSLPNLAREDLFKFASKFTSLHRFSKKKGNFSLLPDL